MDATSQTLHSDDAAAVAALRRGDEDVFGSLVDEHGRAMLRVAGRYVDGGSAAEEVVRETWRAALRGIDGFEGRASIKTWIFGILIDTARARARDEQGSLPVPSVEPERFLGPDHPRRPGNWRVPPVTWDAIPERTLLGRETLDLAGDTIRMLPDDLRGVIVLRDVEGWSGPDVCATLDLSEDEQLALLHRARSRVRGALERHFGEAAA